MDGGIYSSRDEEEKGGGHLALHLLKKNLWGQPIRGRVTPLSSQPVNPAPQDNPRASVQWTHGLVKRHTSKKTIKHIDIKK